MQRQIYSRHVTQIRVALTMIRCTLPADKAIYVSTPITNGKRLLPWRASLPECVKQDKQAYEALLLDNIIKPNTHDGHLFAQQVRVQTGRPVIDPTPFMADDWTQADYIEFWSCVIEDYAAEVWFNDGWEYSNGCAQEYLVALKCGIPTLDSNGQALPVHRACAMLDSVIPLYQDMEVSAMVLRSVTASIKAFIHTQNG